MGECVEKETDPTCLKLVGSPCQNNQVMAHSWHSHASSLTGLSMHQHGPGESREMAVPVEVGGASNWQWASRDQGAHAGLDN